MSGANGSIDGRVPPERQELASRRGVAALLAEAVSVEPLRAAFERSHLTAGDVARAMGWTTPDTFMVRRTLGMVERTARSGHRARQTHVRRSTALKLAEVLGLDPVDIGL